MKLRFGQFLSLNLGQHFINYTYAKKLFDI
jgi:hypothetical protein